MRLAIFTERPEAAHCDCLIDVASLNTSVARLQCDTAATADCLPVQCLRQKEEEDYFTARTSIGLYEQAYNETRTHTLSTTLQYGRRWAVTLCPPSRPTQSAWPTTRSGRPSMGHISHRIAPQWTASTRSSDPHLLTCDNTKCNRRPKSSASSLQHTQRRSRSARHSSSS